MTTTTGLTRITFPGGVPYFDGPGRIHKHGHIWLKPEAPNTSLPIMFPFQIDDDDYNFVSNPNGLPTDGTLAMFISTDPNNLGPVFNNPGGLFVAPTLSAYNKNLLFGIKAFDSNKYFYLFNINGPNGLVPMDDPIIVNK